MGKKEEKSSFSFTDKKKVREKTLSDGHPNASFPKLHQEKHKEVEEERGKKQRFYLVVLVPEEDVLGECCCCCCCSLSSAAAPGTFPAAENMGL